MPALPKCLRERAPANLAAIALSLTLSGHPCAAQSEAPPPSPPTPAVSPRTPPPEDPQLDDPRLEDDAKAMGSRKPGDNRISPTAEKEGEPSQPGLPGPMEALPGLEGTDYLLRTPVIRSEGVFLTMQRGTVIRGKGGEWWFVFHRDLDGRAERPMILLPCQTLERMVAAAEENPEPVFRTNGQVFVYYGRNFFLPTSAVLAAGAAEGEVYPMIGPPEPPDLEHAGTPDEDSGPTVRDLIDELSGDANGPRALGGQTGAGASAPAVSGGDASAAPDILPEGKLMARRRGRMVRQSAAWAFAFDNDSDAPTEPPMVLVPCLNLETMERLAAKQGDGVVFELSGRVLTYRGRNFVIPTMFQVVRDREVRPLQ